MNKLTEFIDNDDKAMQVSQSTHEFAQVSCGAEHSYALSTTGELFSWGLNFKG